MNDFVTVLLMCTLPAIGNLAGVLLAEFVQLSRRVNGALLHGAAGIALAIIAMELLPRSQPGLSPLLMGLILPIGAMSSILAVRLARKAGKQYGSSGGGWMIYTAIAADLFSDGLITGTGASASLQLGGFLAASQLFANLPGGFAAGSNLRHAGVSRLTRILAGGIVSLPIFLAASVGYLLLRDAPESLQSACLVAIAGLLLAATIEDLIPEGDAPKPRRWSSTLALATGFAGIVIVSGLG